MEPGAKALSEVLQNTSKVYLGYMPEVATLDSSIDVLPEIRSANRAGHVLQLADVDNVNRRFVSWLETTSGAIVPNLGMMVANDYLRDEAHDMHRPEALSLQVEAKIYPSVKTRNWGEYVSDLEDAPSHLMPDVRNADYRVISIVDLLDNKVPAGSFRGKLVVLGTHSKVLLRPEMTSNSVGLADSPNWVSTAERFAHQLDSLFAVARGERTPFRAFSGTQSIGFLLVLAVLLSGLFTWIRAVLYSVPCLILVLAVQTALSFTAFRFGFWLPLVPMLAISIGIFLWHLMLSVGQNIRLRERLGVLQSVLDTMPDPIFVANRQHVIRSANAAFYRLALSAPKLPEPLPTLMQQRRKSATEVDIDFPLGRASTSTRSISSGDILYRVVSFRRHFGARLPEAFVPRCLALLQRGSKVNATLLFVQLQDAQAMREADGAEFFELIVADVERRIDAAFADAYFLLRISEDAWLIGSATVLTREHALGALQSAFAWPFSAMDRAVEVELLYATQEFNSDTDATTVLATLRERAVPLSIPRSGVDAKLWQQVLNVVEQGGG
jgi:CHASE2 domain-containing sensor protein